VFAGMVSFKPSSANPSKASSQFAKLWTSQQAKRKQDYRDFGHNFAHRKRLLGKELGGRHRTVSDRFGTKVGGVARRVVQAAEARAERASAPRVAQALRPAVASHKRCGL
jgi:hypothetical protein